MNDVVILTDHRYENPKEVDWYIQQVLTEDNLLKKELELLGLNVIIKDWKSSNIDWQKQKAAIFRSTWDYFDNFKTFNKWIEINKSKIRFINSYNLIRWNLDKSYLFDLQKKNINIPSSVLVKKNQKTTLRELFNDCSWEEAILKPTISGAARHTYRIHREKTQEFDNLFSDLIKSEDFLFQEFLTDITLNGEISLIMIDGKYTHAVRKIAKKGDFRVQDDHGGKVEKYNANKYEIQFARKCWENCPEQPLYARVDIVYDNKGEISLGELELIEPELWFRNNTNSAKLLAEAIYQSM